MSALVHGSCGVLAGRPAGTKCPGSAHVGLPDLGGPTVWEGELQEVRAGALQLPWEHF